MVAIGPDVVGRPLVLNVSNSAEAEIQERGALLLRYVPVGDIRACPYYYAYANRQNSEVLPSNNC